LRRATFSPDGNRLVGVYADGVVVIWDAGEEKLHQRAVTPGPDVSK